MKTVTRYEVRSDVFDMYETDNLFKAYEMYDKYREFAPTSNVTIHEITTTERDITDNARIDNSKKD